MLAQLQPIRPAGQGVTAVPADHAFSQTPSEERANALSHAVGMLLALAALPVTAASIDSVQHPLRQLGVVVFFATMVLMYGVSTAYHLLPVGPAKLLLRRCDHAVIFVFIAGSFTPFALLTMQRGEGAATLLGVWGLALAGMALKLCNRLRSPLPSTALYVLFGWMVAAVARPVLDALAPTGLALLVAGGVAYTLGCLFFLADRRLRYSHFVWHLFVITGSLCHVMAVQHAQA
jgi:hemolysin III